MKKLSSIIAALAQVSTVDNLASTGSWLERIAPWALGFIVLGAAAVALRWAGRKYGTQN